jgi:hypothetical protein
MRIYLGESAFPSPNDDKLVFWEQGIQLGDWKDNRKASINVPLSEAIATSYAHLTFRRSNIMVLSSHISLFQKAVQHRSVPIQILTQNYHSIQPSVFTSSSYLIVVLTRYMPKKREVHLKSLIKTSEETKPEPQIQVTPLIP